MNQKVLVVEDDASILEIVALGLSRAGFEVRAEGDGIRALEKFQSERFDAVVLDVMLPNMNGISLCRAIRATSGIPIVMVTAKTETEDVVAGLEVGADDYITKPFEIPELVARLRAVLRRVTGSGNEKRMQAGSVAIDVAAHRVQKNEREVELTATEFKLLVELARNEGNVLTRGVLLDRVWGYDFLGDSRVVDMAIKRLRSKVEDDPADPQLIQTVRGVGYRLDRNRP
jgi:two-component system, OmpR family, response regulator MtrA